MDLEVADKAFLITGGSDGLGLALGDALAAAGAHVAFCGRNQARLSEASARVGRHGQRVLPIKADVTVGADIERLIEEVSATFGRLDGLVNSAGVHDTALFEQTSEDKWQADFELKVLAAVHASRLALPLLKTSKGSILNVLSIYARFQPAESMPSSVLRSAGLALTKGLATEVAPYGVRVNAVLVGAAISGQWDKEQERSGVSQEELRERVVSDLRIPLGRPGNAEEFADLGSFLLSARASYITGTAVNFDGGLSPVP